MTCPVFNLKFSPGETMWKYKLVFQSTILTDWQTCKQTGRRTYTHFTWNHSPHCKPVVWLEFSAACVDAATSCQSPKLARYWYPGLGHEKLDRYTSIRHQNEPLQPDDVEEAPGSVVLQREDRRSPQWVNRYGGIGRIPSRRETTNRYFSSAIENAHAQLWPSDTQGLAQAVPCPGCIYLF